MIAHVPRPKTGETPIRHVRVSDEVWDEIKRLAAENERTITAEVLAALQKHIAPKAAAKRSR